MNRSEIIDRIEEYYNDRDQYENVERILERVSGKDLDLLSDDDPDEGFYSNFTTDELEEVLSQLDSDQAGEYYGSIDYTYEELLVLEDAMKNYSDPMFTRDPKMSKIAKNLLMRLR